MIISNKDNESDKIIGKNNIIQKSYNINEDLYIINIYCSKDNSKIIFKVEQERIQTFYFYEKYDLKDFKQKYKQFISKDNIKNVFTFLKQIIERNSTKLEKNNLKMNIIIYNKSEEILSFSLRKKIVSQKRLNSLLIEQIENNKTKIKVIKKQSLQYDKSIKSQNDNIDNTNNRIEKINNNMQNIIEDIKNINCNINNLNELKKKIILNEENAKNNDNRKINKNNNIIKNINLIDKTEDNNNNNCNYNSNIYKDKITKIEKRNRIFFFWNTIIMTFIFYLFYNCNQINNNIIIEKKYSQKLNKKLKILNNLDNLSGQILSSFEVKMKKIIREVNNNNFYKNRNNKPNNIINYIKEQYKNDNTKKNNQKNNRNKNKEIKDNNFIYEDIDNQIKKGENKNKKIDNIIEIENNKKVITQKEKYILNNIEEINYLKKKIKDKIKYKIKDINFILKYKSDDLEYTDFYNNCKEVTQNLILIKYNEGKKVGIISNNIIDILNKIIINDYSKVDDNDDKNFIGYIFTPDNIDELNFKEFFNVYKVFISIYKEIYYFLIKNNHFNQSFNNKLNLEKNSDFIGKIDKIEIYQIKLIYK